MAAVTKHDALGRGLASQELLCEVSRQGLIVLRRHFLVWKKLRPNVTNHMSECASLRRPACVGPVAGLPQRGLPSLSGSCLVKNNRQARIRCAPGSLSARGCSVPINCNTPPADYYAVFCGKKRPYTCLPHDIMWNHQHCPLRWHGYLEIGKLEVVHRGRVLRGRAQVNM